MNPSDKPGSAGRAPSSSDEPSPGDKKTPSTDMQPEDTGTSDSGATGLGTAAEGAMKQTSKTGAESGSKG